MDKPSQQDIESLVKLFGESDWKEMHIKTDTLEFLYPRTQAVVCRIGLYKRMW